jgi:antitoxin HicB
MNARHSRKPNLDAYRFSVRPLTRAEGGGFLVEYPDIPGCMSDGATVEEAIAHGKEALRDTIAVFGEIGRMPPPPAPEAAQWRQRLPRTLYAKLTQQAENEGVSINSLVTAMIAEALGARLAKPNRTKK